MPTQVDMKRSTVEQDGLLLGETPDETGEEYYYGLTLRLERPELDKLGLENPQVGAKHNIVGVVKIISHSKSDHGESLELQMVSMGVQTGDTDRVNKMYEED
ncbi:MAG: hypothetical protein GY753_09805 [Gammaproteobacteria bacterium]|nr:hypothetical protein [Gammaproteobacteria bacterium]